MITRESRHFLAQSLQTQQSPKIGAIAYLGKPFDEIELMCIVENLLLLKSREQKIAELNRNLVENVLQRFLPPKVVTEIVEGKRSLDEAPKVGAMTILFADLCGFTRESELIGPTKIGSMLNTFLSRMTDLIFKYDGIIDKFIGDGIMVIFGAPMLNEETEQVEKAAICAREMLQELENLNKEWQKDELPSFQMRIGIHAGPCISGMFGGTEESGFYRNRANCKHGIPHREHCQAR
ncbi:MAG: adenylate/guanylate cyclase domain-containing protein [Oligoflexus sp.]